MGSIDAAFRCWQAGLLEDDEVLTLDRSVWSCPCLPLQYRLSIGEALNRWRVEDFLNALASVPNPRDARGRRYAGAGLLAIATSATAR
jgi:hypothetical protein